MPGKKRTADMRTVSIEIEPHECRAMVRPESLDEEARTVELVASTGARVRRYNWRDGEYDEELSLDKKHVRMGRLKNRAPLLDTHWKWETRSVLGVVEEARLEGGEIVVRVRFSQATEEARIAWEQVREGVLTKVSIGYRVFKFVDAQGEDDPVRVLRAVDWEPFEVSLVPVGADDFAGVRSGLRPTDTNTCEVQLRADDEGDRNMPGKKNSTPPNAPEGERSAAEPNTPTPAAAPTGDGGGDDSAQRVAEAEQRAAQRAAENERKRIGAIETLARKHPTVSDEVRQACIDEGLTVEQAGHRMLESLAEDSERSGPAGPSGARLTEDGDAQMREHMEAALVHRADPTQDLPDGGRRFMSMSLLEMGRELLPRGEREADSKIRLAQRVMASTDYPNLLANVGNKTLSNAYELEMPNYEPFCSRGSMADFKAVSRARVGDFPDMQKVGESGEITYGTFGEEAESYALGSYWRGIRFTREMLINDDLGAFVRLMRSFGYSAARMKLDVVWGIFTANAAMSDGTALFHAAHGNLGSGAIGTSGVSDARKAMRLQTSVDGKRVAIRPSFMIAPVALQTTAESFLRPVAATKTDDVNVFSQQFTLITEPRLDDVSAAEWYMAAQPGAVDTIEYAYLDGQGDAPMVEMERDFDTGGLKMKAGLDFAAKALDWRGLYKSSGV